MHIQSVKLQANGYLINSSLSVPNAPANRHYQQVQDWIAEGNTPEPEFTPEELQAQAASEDKQARLAQIDSLKVTTASGKVFDADKPARDALTSAVAVGEAGMSTEWKLSDNSVVLVTWEELREALLLLGSEHTKLIALAE